MEKITPQQYASLLVESIFQVGESKGCDDMFGVVPVHMIPEDDRKRVQLEMMLLQRWLRLFGQSLPVHKWCLAGC
jgi:hypothetical protein